MRVINVTASDILTEEDVVMSNDAIPYALRIYYSDDEGRERWAEINFNETEFELVASGKG